MNYYMILHLCMAMIPEKYLCDSNTKNRSISMKNRILVLCVRR